MMGAIQNIINWFSPREPFIDMDKYAVPLGPTHYTLVPDVNSPVFRIWDDDASIYLPDSTAYNRRRAVAPACVGATRLAPRRQIWETPFAASPRDAPRRNCVGAVTYHDMTINRFQQDVNRN